jgi:dephospho-CoA kinase
MKIIGITGTLGAGKGTIVQYLLDNKNFKHYSVRQFLIEELQRRGTKVIDRNAMTLLGNELRAEHSPSYITDCLYEQAKENGQNAVIESIRTPGEVLSLRDKADFCLLAIDADRKIRYERILQRNSETDHVSFEQFVAGEEREMNDADPNKQNISKCIEMADFLLNNNGNREDLYKNVEKILEKIL